MSSTPGAGPNDPSAPQAPSSREGAGESALGYGDIDPLGVMQGAGVSDGGEHAGTRDVPDEQEPQPVDPALIAGGENLVGAANHVTTGPDTMGANLSDEQDDAERTDRERANIDDDGTSGT